MTGTKSDTAVARLRDDVRGLEATLSNAREEQAREQARLQRVIQGYEKAIRNLKSTVQSLESTPEETRHLQSNTIHKKMQTINKALPNVLDKATQNTTGCVAYALEIPVDLSGRLRAKVCVRNRDGKLRALPLPSKPRDEGGVKAPTDVDYWVFPGTKIVTRTIAGVWR